MRKTKHLLLALSLLVLTFGGAAFAVPSFSLESPKDNDIAVETFAPSEGQNNLDTEDVTYTFKTYEEYFTDNEITSDISLTTIEGNGSSASPYIINSTNDFWYATKYLNWNAKYVELACDVVLNDETFGKEGKPSGGDGVVYKWSPISHGAGLSLNGCGHSISGFYRDSTEESETIFSGGLFAVYSLSVVENVNIENVFLKTGEHSEISIFATTIQTASNIKILSGNIYANGRHSASIAYLVKNLINCENYLDIYTTSQEASGLVTKVGSSMINCKNYGNVTKTNFSSSNIARLSGLTYTTSKGAVIEDCVNYGNLTTNHSQAAGIVCWTADTIIRDCKNYGNIKAHAYIGGIASYVTSETLMIEGCENYGAILPLDPYNRSRSGEILGGNFSSSGEEKNCNVIIRNCYAKSISAVPIVGHCAFNLFLSECRVDYVNNLDGSTDAYALVGQYEIYCDIQISNIEINNYAKALKNIYLFYYIYDGYNIKNILIKSNTEELRTTELESKYVATGISKEEQIKDGCVLINKNAESCYYGNDLSGYYINWRTGKIGLIALDSNGYWNKLSYGEITESNLNNLGLVKK